MFPYISSTGNGNIIVDVGFERDDEMNDERVDLIIDMYRKKYDWSKHVWVIRKLNNHMRTVLRMMVQRKKRLEKEVTVEWKKK